ncbi:dual specificity protein kinase shkD-like [Sipha flava]|uniref:receptor protein-tyrosine kinase n=1 Tax=Sipha flava TaxID=143950 RepID=A0A8B8GLA0_9HEMI|nr:dual specificity protein kinase shkD-like [Sipha flava]
MRRNTCGLWCALLVLLQAVPVPVHGSQTIKDDLMVVMPTSTPADDVRSVVADHRRQRNVTRLVGALRRASSIPAGLLTASEAPENSDSSMSRVKKKIKHKRTWDEPEAQSSEVYNATSKRPDRIKTRRRLIPSSSTARAHRTAAVVQEDPYYDFGKKIKHTSSSTIGLNVLQDLEMRTSVRSPIVVVSTTEEDGPKSDAVTATMDVAQDKSTIERSSQTPRPTRMPPSRVHGSMAGSSGPRRPENLQQTAECVYPRFTRRNKSRSQRDVTVRCLPAEPDARTTRILSTVVTSVSSVKGNHQKKNDTLDRPAAGSTTGNENNNATDVYHPAVVHNSGISIPTTVRPEPIMMTTGHPKYLRSRYKNISLPEYLEITKVNQKRLNSSSSSSTTTTEHATRPISTEVTTSESASSSFLLPTENITTTAETQDTSTIHAASDGKSPTYPSPPNDLQDFVYLSNGTSTETPPDTITTAADNGVAVEARQRRPVLTRNITRGLSTAEHDVGVVYPEGLASSTYLLTFLAIVPLVLVIAFAFKLAIQRKKKKVFDSSEYSSEYNRSPLDFNTITSSPITTKLPRVPQHIVWDAEKTSVAMPLPLPPPPPSLQVPPSNSRWEFPREKLRLQTILGQGNFGQVWKAEADDISGHEGLTRLVAVKMVKEDAASREREDLIRELSIMQHLGSHPSVVTLLGCCTEKEPYLLIMEYVMYGKLLAFLRDRRTRSHYFNFSDSTSSLTSRDLTVFAYCVARGMDFLVSKKIVHRDLAARNVLVDHNKLCKIADFGMSRNVRDTNQIYEQRHTKGALPIRWMAPESLHYSIFTYKTDVWSFGVLMWEIVTLGSTPYCTMGAREVMRRVREGYRLDKPAHCRSELFRVITKCWAADPSKRPTFADLKQELGALLENPEFEGSYVDLESLVDESDANVKDRQ